MPGWLSGALVMAVASAMVRALPPPPNPAKGFGANFYLWIYRTVHIIVSNYDKVKETTKQGGTK